MSKFLAIFKKGLFLKSDGFTLFNWSLPRFITYFLLLNLMMFIPLTYSIYELDDSIQNLLGVSVTDTLALEDLPKGCEIVNQRFVCESMPLGPITIEINEAPFVITFFEPLDEGVSGLRLEETTADLMISNNQLLLDYRGFSYTPFSDFENQPTDDIYQSLFEGFYPSIRPYIALPLIFVFVGGYIITNIILLLTLAGLSMLFKLTISSLPSFKDMLKLFIMASTIPAVINFGIGLFGLSAFSSLVYNFLTPLFVYIIYRRHMLEEEQKRKP